MATGKQKRDYHAARARAELESAYRARCPETATLHLELSSLHLRRALQFGHPVHEERASDLGWLQDFGSVHRRWLRPDGRESSTIDGRDGLRPATSASPPGSDPSVVVL